MHPKSIIKGLGFLVLAVLFVSSSAVADAGYGSSLDAHAVYIQEFPSSKNLCAESEITFLGGDIDKEGLSLLRDGIYSTGMDIDFADYDGVQVRFIGRVPWVNIIRIYHSADFEFNLRIKDVYKKYSQTDFGREEICHEDGLTESVFRFGDMRVSAFVLIPVKSHEGDIPKGHGQVYEALAFFDSRDPDDGYDEVGVEYVQYYHNKPCGGSNITGTKSDALDFRDELVGHLGWTDKYSWGNYSAFEMDFGTHNNSYADAVDFAYFSGHGYNGNFQFSHENMDCMVWYGECFNQWGDNDLEWIAISSCRTLRKSSTNQYWSGWYGCFNGLHVMLGWHTVSLDVNTGKPFGHQLGRHHHTVWTSWKNACRSSHNVNLWTHTRKIVGIAEEEIHFSDHAWGAGPVAPDYPNNGNYWYIVHEFRGYKDREPTLSVNPSELKPIAASVQQQPVILVTDDVLNNSGREEIPRLMVDPVSVTETYVEDIAQLFCSNFGIFCDYDLVYNGNEGEYEAFDGPHELEVNEASGGWEYNQTDIYGIPPAAPPFLPNDNDIQDSAQAFWNTLGFLSPTAIMLEPECMKIGAIESATGTEFEDSSYYMNVNVTHMRTEYGYEIVGPGAYLEVVFGDFGGLQSAYYGGWRPVYDGGWIEPITLADALWYVAGSGPEVTIGGMPLCDEFLVDNANLAYYEAPKDSFILELQPVWQVNGFCITDYDTIAYQLLIPADYPIPQGMIQIPSQDTSINCEDSLYLSATASDGTPPYQYDWYSDSDGHLGNGQNLYAANLSCTGREGETATHTIILEVTDANSKKDWTSVTVSMIGQYMIGDANGDQAVNVSDAVYIINYVFVGGDPPDPLQAGDCNCDGKCNVSDAVWIINYVFVGGNIPGDIDGDNIPDC
jgi:hypothetical protein